jgi:hypothetical protein
MVSLDCQTNEPLRKSQVIHRITVRRDVTINMTALHAMEGRERRAADMVTMLLQRWLLPSPEPSPIANFHVGASLEDMEVVSRSQPIRGRLCRHGHRVMGRNAYRRKNGKLECRTCRAAASKRYRARLQD